MSLNGTMNIAIDSHPADLLQASIPIAHRTALGALHAGDCMDLLRATPSGIVDCVFADPPFNLGKTYGSSVDDARPPSEYVDWCMEWLEECIRVLAPGGALFVYNLPKWNILIGARLIADPRLEFRHDIAVDMKAGFKIAGRLYPSHYSLLYLTKGQPRVFRSIRTPIQTCRHCGGEVKDYGGYRAKMHPDGINLTDVWSDIVPVRHRKFKTEGRNANALSTKLLDRVVLLTTVPGDLVLDPFGGSGTTFAVCEKHHRRWLGSEIDFAPAIVQRLRAQEVDMHRNTDSFETLPQDLVAE